MYCFEAVWKHPEWNGGEGRESPWYVDSMVGGYECVLPARAYTLPLCVVVLENTLGNSDMEKLKGHSVGPPHRYASTMECWSELYVNAGTVV